MAAGAFIDSLEQRPSRRIAAALRRAAGAAGFPREPEAVVARRRPPPGARDLSLDVDDVDLPATLVLPACARGVVLLAHVGGGHRSSPRDQHVMRGLVGARLGTLAIDLLTDTEAADTRADLRHDVAFVARRLRAVARWAGAEAGCGPLPLGLFGSGSAVAAAVMAAADDPGLLSALVSCGGRPDLAARHLPRLSTPTLMILGLGPHDAPALKARTARVVVDWLVANVR